MEGFRRFRSNGNNHEGWDDDASRWSPLEYASIQRDAELNAGVERVSVATAYDSYLLNKAGPGATRVARVLSCLLNLKEIEIGNLLDVPSNFDCRVIARNVDVLLRGLARNKSSNLKVLKTIWCGGPSTIVEVLRRFEGLEELAFGCNEQYCKVTREVADSIASCLVNLHNLKKISLRCTACSVQHLGPIVRSMLGCSRLRSLHLACDVADAHFVPSLRGLLKDVGNLVEAPHGPLETISLSLVDIHCFNEGAVSPAIEATAFVRQVLRSTTLRALEIGGSCVLDPGLVCTPALYCDSKVVACPLSCLKLYNVTLRGDWFRLLSRFRNLEQLTIHLENDDGRHRTEDPRAWRHLLEGLPLLSTFRYMDFARQRQRDSGAISVIATCCASHPTLRDLSLHIGRNDGTTGECHLIPALRGLASGFRGSLELTLPNSDARNLRSVSEGIAEATRLMRLSIWPHAHDGALTCGVRKEGQRPCGSSWTTAHDELLEAAGRCKSLRELELNEYAWWGEDGIPREQSSMLYRAVEANCSLWRCNVRGPRGCDGESSNDDASRIRFLLRLNRHGRYLLSAARAGAVPLGLWPAVLTKAGAVGGSSENGEAAKGRDRRNEGDACATGGGGIDVLHYFVRAVVPTLLPRRGVRRSRSSSSSATAERQVRLDSSTDEPSIFRARCGGEKGCVEQYSGIVAGQICTSICG